MNNNFNLVDALYIAAGTNKGITFIEGEKDERFLSYSDVLIESLQLLAGLQRNGVATGDEVVFQLEDNENFIKVFFACLLGGLTPVPVTVVVTQSDAEKLRFIWETLKYPYLVLEGKLSERLLSGDTFADDLGNIRSNISRHLLVEQLYDNIDEPITNRDFSTSDLAYVQFSSGSTSIPKGVMLTHHNLTTNVIDMISSSAITADDSTMSWLPLTHDLGLIGFVLTPMLAKINCYLMQTSLFIRRPSLWMKKMNEHRSTITASPNFGYSYFLKRFRHKEAEGWDLSSVRVIVNGAEPISNDLLERFLDEMSVYKLNRNCMYPVYGMAEACLGVAFPQPGEPVKTVVCDRNNLGPGDDIKFLEKHNKRGVVFVIEGAPLKSMSIRICDDHNQELPEDTVGHIHIRGANVTAGYYRNTEATSAVLSEDGWLRTGDIGFIYEGDLVVIGRSKDIIFVNGRNFYSHDLERMTGTLDDISTAEVVVAGTYDSELSRDVLLAFVAYRGDINSFVPIAERIQSSLQSGSGLSLDKIIPVSRIPKTTSGKKQRYKLVESYKNNEYSDYISGKTPRMENKKTVLEQKPLSPKEILLFDIWSEILQHREFGIDDSFFSLGGNSLQVTLMLARLQRRGFELQIESVFGYPTIRQLALHIRDVVEVSESQKIEVSNTQDAYPLSSGQRRIYIESQFKDSEKAFNIPLGVIINGDFSKRRVEDTLNDLIKHHAILRTRFIEVDGEPYQKVEEFAELNLVYDEIDESQLDQVFNSFVRSFDISKAPLFRVGLYKISENRYLFILDMHHLISDGSSISLFMEQFFQRYQGHKLPESQIQYKDFAVWENSQDRVIALNQQKDYWTNQFKEQVPILNMPLDYPRPSAFSFEGSRVFFTLPSNLIEEIESCALKQGATPYMVFLSVYYLLLYSYSGQQDLVVGSPISGRTSEQTHSLLGMFVNMLPIRVQLEGDMSFAKLLDTVKNTSIGAYANQDYPFDILVQDINETMGHRQHSLFTTALVFQNFQWPSVDGITYEVCEVTPGTAQYDLLMSVLYQPNHIRVELEYSTDVYSEQTIQRFAEKYIDLLEKVLGNVNQPFNQSLNLYRETSLNNNEDSDSIIFKF